MDKVHSFTAASTLPVKLFRSAPLAHALEGGRIPPLHIQFIPTNKCNLGCSFCSCASRNRSLEMPLSEVARVIERFAELGTRAVTITGGGEPLLHPHIESIIDLFAHHGIEMGLVTNGVLLHDVPLDTLRKLTWCRISASDEREMSDFGDAMCADIDWAFSYVLSSKPNVDNLARHFRFAEAHGFTHVRVVSDLLDTESVDMESVRAQVDSPLAIWQGRKEWTCGGECRIAALKPVIGADGIVYPCCGVQYAHEVADLDLPASMSMGHWSEFVGQNFDGSQCDRCYYDDYNRVLSQMDAEIAHLPFV